MIISISGPIRTGKSTIINLLKDTLPEGTVFVEDLFTTCWEYMRETGNFTDFTEVHKDRDFLFMYISKICSQYKEIIDTYKDYDGLVVLENCYLDYLVYSQLSSWYHYPIIEFQETTIIGLLKTQHEIGRIYMTTPDDANYPLNKSTLDRRTTKAAFTRNRKLETLYYDLYREGERIFTLPPDLFSCDRIILDDLVDLGLLS